MGAQLTPMPHGHCRQRLHERPGCRHPVGLPRAEQIPPRWVKGSSARRGRRVLAQAGARRARVGRCRRRHGKARLPSWLGRAAQRGNRAEAAGTTAVTRQNGCARHQYRGASEGQKVRADRGGLLPAGGDPLHPSPSGRRRGSLRWCGPEPCLAARSVRVRMSTHATTHLQPRRRPHRATRSSQGVEPAWIRSSLWRPRNISSQALESSAIPGRTD